jgi:MFS transporter, putative metabolite:H+ symporter
MKSVSGTNANIANRMDRLPISSVHRRVLIALAIAYFFEYGDLNTFTFAAPAMMKSWHLTVKDIAFINSSAFLGMFLGASFGGLVADKIGRKKAIILSIVSLSIFSLLNAFAWSLTSFNIIRFITGAATSALLVNANTYLIEFFPSKVRGKYQGLAIAIGITGIPITGWVSHYFVQFGSWSWRLIFIWGSLGIFSLFLYRRIFESPRWYESRGELDKAESIMQKIESRVRDEKGALPEPASYVAPIVQRKAKFAEIFKGPYLNRTIILTVAWVLQTLALYGFGSWVPTLLVKQGFKLDQSLIYTSLITLGAPLGSLLGSVVADRFERKINLVVTSLFIAVAAFLYGATLLPEFIVVFGILINMIERTYAANLYAYTSELYPTETRAIGQGFTYGVGRFSNMFGPLIISFLYTGYGYMSVFIFIALCWIGSAIALGLGPRTSKRSLEELNSFGTTMNANSSESATV